MTDPRCSHPADDAILLDEDISECHGVDERIPLALRDPQITPHDLTAQPIATRLDDMPPTPPLNVTEPETEKCPSPQAEAEMVNSIRDGEIAPANRDKVSSSRPKPRRKGDGDDGPRNQDGNDAVVDDETGIDAGSRQLDDGTETGEDPNDDDYTDNADAVDSHTEE